MFAIASVQEFTNLDLIFNFYTSFTMTDAYILLTLLLCHASNQY